jgi:hypothetical protein
VPALQPVRSPLDLGRQNETIGSFQQPDDTGFILGTIAVLGLVFLYMVGQFYDGIGTV